MKKVTVIGMDWGDKNHKAIGLSESGGEIDRAEVPCTSGGVRAYLKRHPGALLAIETGTHCRCATGRRLSTTSAAARRFTALRERINPIPLLENIRRRHALILRK
ncbi:MAG TPA: hypothetical protein PLJ32_06155 [Kiritimatiellia bacterium]|jgi:hypothetical protein|nr:hypothetical protein [Kiritimatiellia bacterium]HPW75542.1 hypothetical protein [Kiritimatiellia bacterium]